MQLGHLHIFTPIDPYFLKLHSAIQTPRHIYRVPTPFTPINVGTQIQVANSNVGTQIQVANSRD